MDSSESKHNQLALDKACRLCRPLQQLSEVHLRQAERERYRRKHCFSALSIGMVFTDRTHRIIYAARCSRPAQPARAGCAVGRRSPAIDAGALFVMPEHSVHGEEELRATSWKLDDKRCAAFQHIQMYTTTANGSLWILKTSPPSAPLPSSWIFLARRDTLTGYTTAADGDTELERMVKRADRREQPWRW